MSNTEKERREDLARLRATADRSRQTNTPSNHMSSDAIAIVEAMQHIGDRLAFIAAVINENTSVLCGVHEAIDANTEGI